MEVKEKTTIAGTITLNVYRTGMVEKLRPYLEQRKALRSAGRETTDVDRTIDGIKASHFIRTAFQCSNIVVGTSDHGLDLIIQRLVGTNTYSLNITHGEIGTGQTAAALSDTALTAPTNRAGVGFQQDYGQTDAIVQFFFSDSQLANQTYYEFGTFVDGSTTLGSGQLFNHALFSTPYAKTSGTDTTVQVDFTVANA